MKGSSLALAAASGLTMTAAFPRLQLPWAAWLALLPLLVALRDLRAAAAFRVGMAAGMCHALTLVYWVVPTMVTYGNLPHFVAVPILCLLAAYLALYWGIFAALLPRLGHTPLRLWLVIPALWVALEYGRGHLLSGFPWALLGYSQVALLPLIQVSDILGIYGVSFLVAALNGAFFLLLLQLSGHTWQGRVVTWRASLPALAGTVTLCAIALIYGHARIASIDRHAAAADTVMVAALQGNIAQGEKWNPSLRNSAIEKYLRLSHQAATAHAPQLIVWPETATPFYLFTDPEPTRVLREGLAGLPAAFVIGSPAVERRGHAGVYFNSAYLLPSGGGSAAQRYDKAHLVPFGEYVPLQRWLPFVGKIVAQVGDFAHGPMGATLAWGTYRLGIQICYEIIFPELARAQVAAGAGLLLNLTNDAWYGRSSAPYQHFAMAVARAVENRRALVRSANTGISGFVDPVGRVHATTSLFEEAVVAARLPLMIEESFYSRHGDLFAGGCLLVSLVFGLAGMLGRRPSMAA